MRVILAGWQASRRKREEEVLRRVKVQGRCFSFANLFKIKGFPYYISGFEGSYEACCEAKIPLMIDSGVVSYRGFIAAMTKRGKTDLVAKLPTHKQFAELYAEWVIANARPNWDFYVTVDFQPKAPLILEWHKYVEKLGLRPTPVFHGDVHLDWLKKYVDKGYKKICLGGTTLSRSGKRVIGQYFDGVFNFGAKHGIIFHGLAQTSPWIMCSYPWDTVDSAWWTKAAGYGTIMKFDPVGERMGCFHISEKFCASAGKDAMFKNNKFAMSKLKSELKQDGFDIKLLQSDFTERHVYNAKAMVDMAEYATKRHRGSWNPLF